MLEPRDSSYSASFGGNTTREWVFRLPGSASDLHLFLIALLRVAALCPRSLFQCMATFGLEAPIL